VDIITVVDIMSITMVTEDGARQTWAEYLVEEDIMAGDIIRAGHGTTAIPSQGLHRCHINNLGQ